MSHPILTVGSVAFDSIKTPFGEGSRLVGGAATFFSVAASFFTDVRLVAVVGEDFGDTELAVFGAVRSICRVCNVYPARRSGGRANTASTSTRARPSIPT